MWETGLRCPGGLLLLFINPLSLAQKLEVTHNFLEDSLLCFLVCQVSEHWDANEVS